jgi:radical SAM superfamily enzyme YgiQ (UPF0313 family)
MTNHKKLKVVLVQPSTHESVQSLFTYYKGDGVGAKPPLAVLIMATYLRSQGFQNVHCLDAQLENLTPEATVDQIEGMNPDLVGITTWTDFWYPVWKTVQLIKKRLPRCKVILGGPHCSVFPRETLEYSEADFVVRGDGEEVLLKLMQNINEGKQVEEQSGLYRKIDEKILEPACDLAEVVDLTKIPHPDRLLLPYKRYNSVLNPAEFETTMITSRGCPHKCNFCKMDVQKVYCRTTEQVVEEFRAIAELGITDVQIYDDTFTWSKKRVLEICHGLLDNNIKINWAIRDRVKRADPDIYRLMKQAGCYRIHFGVETGSKRILDATGKATTLEEAESAISMAKTEGFDTMAYYMFGFPSETRQDMEKTVSFAKKLDTSYAAFAVTIPYAGTALYDLGLDQKIIPYDFWKEYTKNPTPNFRIPHLIEDHLSREDLINMKNSALFNYYFRPKTIWRELRSLSSWKEFRRKSKMAINILSDSMGKATANKVVHHDSKNINMYHNLTG